MNWKMIEEVFAQLMNKWLIFGKLLRATDGKCKGICFL